MTYYYAPPSVPSSLRPNVTESELSFVVPVARRNYIINPSFEIDDIGETQPYGWDVGEYTYATNQMTSFGSVGSVVSENAFNGARAMRIVFSSTDLQMVYGRTQPILVPIEHKTDQRFVDGNAVYTVRGALSFYVFAPEIVPASPFSVFNQEAGTSHSVTINVYANELNNVPTGKFNEQTIITTNVTNINVSQSVYFSEDIEPNVIGRRKNPEWKRYVVYFNVDCSEGVDTFLRFSIQNTVNTGKNFLFYLDAVQCEFFGNEFQKETTYFDGDYGETDILGSDGYYWDGAPKKSTSFRSAMTYSGGILFNFTADFDYNVLSTTGYGIPSPQNTITPFVTVDGQQYVGSNIENRKISINGYLVGDSQLDSIRKSGILQFLLSKSKNGIAAKHRFYYRVATDCNVYSDYTYFDAVVEKVNVGAFKDAQTIKIDFEINNLDVYFAGNNYAYTQKRNLLPVKTLDTYAIIPFQAQGGNPNPEYKTDIRSATTIISQSYFGYQSYSLSANGPVYCWCELSNGSILLGGKFTEVSYTIDSNDPVIQSCLNIAMLRPDGTILPIRDFTFRNNKKKFNKLNGVTGPNATVFTILQTNDNTIFVGGRFKKVLGRERDCRNIWAIPLLDIEGRVIGNNKDVEGGLVPDSKNAGYVKTMVYYQNSQQIFVGGYFAKALKSTSDGSSQLRNCAIYKINSSDKWSQLHYGATHAVSTMAITGAFLLIGGEFDAMYADNNVAAYTQTRRAAVYALSPSVPSNKRIKSFTQILPMSVKDYTKDISAKNSLIGGNGYINKILKVPGSGSAIVGGWFTKLDMSDNIYPTPSINYMDVSSIFKWDGYSKFTMMGAGAGNSPEIARVFPAKIVNDICHNPHNDDIYVVGEFGRMGNLGQSISVARWTKNRWEALDFEMQVTKAYSVFISKRGYGFISVKSEPKKIGNQNKYFEPAPIIVENVGIETPFVLEITNPITNSVSADIVSIYNASTEKSMSFNMSVGVGETITIDFTKSNVRPTSNFRNRVSNSIVGGGTFANFYLAEGKNVLKILGGLRAPSNGTFVTWKDLEVVVRYQSRQISPYQIFESEPFVMQESFVGWTLGASRLGIDTLVIGNLATEYPLIPQAFILDVDEVGVNTVVTV